MVRVPRHAQKKGVLNGFLRKNPPFSADFRFARVRKTAKSKKTYIQIRRFGSLNQKRSPFAPFYPDFFRHFRHSGSPDRLFFIKQRTEICNSG